MSACNEVHPLYTYMLWQVDNVCMHACVQRMYRFSAVLAEKDIDHRSY